MKNISTIIEKLLLIPVYLVKLIKLCLPYRLFSYLKRNPFFLKFYKILIKKTGFSGDLIPWQKQQEKYRFITQRQNSILSSYTEFKPVIIVIKGDNHKLIKISLDSIKNSVLQPQLVILFTKAKNLKKSEDFLQYQFNFIVCSSLDEIDNSLDALPVCWFEHGDKIHPNALGCFLSYLSNEVDNSFIYSDIDFYNNIERHNPQLFPDWDPDLHLSTSYIKSSVLISSFSFLKKGIRDNVSISHFISQEYCNSVTDNSSILKIAHIPLVLTSCTIRSVSYFRNEQCFNSGLFDTEAGKYGFSLKWNHKNKPLVSLIIPTKNQYELVRQCIESIYNKTVYDNFEIILVDNNSDETDALDYFDLLSQQEKVKLIKYPHEFNYSAINNFAVQHADGEVIGLINNDVAVIEPEWLDYMVGHVLRSDIGCVGAKLLYENNLIQHGGVVLGYGGGAGHAHKYFQHNSPGYLNRLAVTNQFSAVTAACLLIEKKDFLAVGGLNEQDLKVAFNDVDFCLKILSLGLKNIYCAESVLYHFESISRGQDDTKDKQLRFSNELKFLKSRWSNYIERDPAYNPYLTLKHENFSIKLIDE
jgi:GT2 family glycosyltransferase